MFLSGASSQFPKLTQNNKLLFVVSASTQRQTVVKADLQVLLQVARKELYKGVKNLKDAWK